MRKILVTLLTLSTLVSCLEKPKRYEVLVTYCDSRPPKRFYVMSHRIPDNNSISTYKQAVPKFENQMNVCEVKTIREVKN
jgi:hypothetical protein